MSAASCKVPPVPRAQQWPRGPWNMLHEAARDGSIEGTVSILSMGSIDINQREPQGWTPLMHATNKGHSPVVRILLNKGANVSIVADDGFTALHTSAQHGYLAVTKMLMVAGADVEAADWMGATPLYAAAHGGHWEVMRALIEAGANPNSRCPDGETPLFGATFKGHAKAIRELLRAKADPLLAKTIQTPAGFVTSSVPLDNAAARGNSEVVHELIRRVGIEGCGGPTGGENALHLAAENGHMDVMAMLADVGVVDRRSALVSAASSGQEGPVKFLLQQHKKNKTTGKVAYVNSRNPFGQTPLIASILACSPRVGRLLVDAGADTTSTIRTTSASGEVTFNDTPLAFTSHSRRDMISGKYATEDKLHRLEAIRRLLLQVEAVHAVSWLWPSDVPAIAHAAQGTRGTKTTSTSLSVVLLVLRRRTTRRGVLLAALFRYSRKK